MRFLAMILFFPLVVSAQECFHPDGQPYKNHWLASIETIKVEQAKNEAAKETITQWSARALLCEAALEEALKNQDGEELFSFDCDGFSDFIDGGGGRVWKPVSDNNGLPVFLLPPEYLRLLPDDGVDRVRVFFARDGLEIKDKDKFRGATNGNRYTHDVSIRTDEPLVIRLERADAFIECVNVDNASVRYD